MKNVIYSSIKSSQQIDPLELEALLRQYPFKAYQQYNLFPESAIVKYHSERVIQAINKKRGSCLVVACNKRKLIGLALLEKLPWETSYFGIKMGRISYLVSIVNSQMEFEIKNKLLQAILLVGSKNNFKQFCFELDTRDLLSIHAAEKNGFYLMANQLVYARDKESLNKIYQLDSDWRIRSFQKSGLSQMLSIARIFKTFGRYHTDIRLPRKKRDKYWEVKTKNYCLNKAANDIYILEKNAYLVLLFFNILRRYQISF